MTSPSIPATRLSSSSAGDRIARRARSSGFVAPDATAGRRVGEKMAGGMATLIRSLRGSGWERVEAAMAEHRKIVPDVALAHEVELGRDAAAATRQPLQYAAPAVDYQRVAVGFATVF